jgi:NADPH:quinone reductase-like Zn-dependent oxidoreductase
MTKPRSEDNSMHAMTLKHYGAKDGYFLTDLHTPEPKQGEVRIKVHASAFGPADYKVSRGIVKFLHARNFPIVLGYDFSGVVDATGPSEGRWKAGDNVFGFLPYGPSNKRGAFGEFLIARADQIALRPSTISHAQAAAAATAGLTAMQGIRDQGRIPPRDARVLITGVSGGVGSVAILVAKKLGAHVTAIGSQRGLELARNLGVDALVDRKRADVFENVTGQFDVIFDAAAAYRWSQWKRKLKRGGTFVTTLPSMAFAVDKLMSLASSSRVQMVYVKANNRDLTLLGQWLSEGMEIPVDLTYPVTKLDQALSRYEKGEFLGRILVDVWNGF